VFPILAPTRNIFGDLDVEVRFARYGVIVSLLDRSESMHAACVEAIAEATAPLVTVKP